MVPRDAGEAHRGASNLELLFDLVFVVAVSFSSAALHDQQISAHLWHGLGGYLAVFFAIWWAWMNFTWFATSFDTDDWLYRISTFVQMGGALIIAAGAGPAINDGDITQVVLGYVVMRLVAVAQWVRVAVVNPGYRSTATRYAVGITVLQILWIACLMLIPAGTALWIAIPLIVLELTVPVVAERARPTPWHPDHLTERFGSFTLIVLGESVLASATAIVLGRREAAEHGALYVVAIAGLVTIGAMWWAYFARGQRDRLVGSLRTAMVFGYFHFAIFAAAGAFSAGVETTVSGLIHRDEVHLGDIAMRATFAVPVALFFLGVWWLVLRPTLSPLVSVVIVALCGAMVASTLLPMSMALTAVCAVLVVVVLEVTTARPEPEASPVGG